MELGENPCANKITFLLAFLDLENFVFAKI